MGIDAVHGDESKGWKNTHVKGKKSKEKSKGKSKRKHENSPKFEGCCGHCGKAVTEAARLSPQEHRR